MTAQRDFFQRRSVQAVKQLAPERRTHIAVAKVLRLAEKRTGWISWHTPNGELRSERTGALCKAMGARAGVFDIALLSPHGQLYFIEFKRGLEPLSDEQDAFAAALRQRAVPYYVARSFDAAVKQLKAWGAL